MATSYIRVAAFCIRIIASNLNIRIVDALGRTKRFFFFVGEMIEFGFGVACFHEVYNAYMSCEGKEMRRGGGKLRGEKFQKKEESPE